MGDWFHRHSPILLEKIMDIKDSIINAIDVMVQKGIEQSQSTTTRRGVVIGIDNGKYQVDVDGSTLNVYDSVGCNPKIGDGVFVQTSNGGLMNAFITGLCTSNAKGGGGTNVVANPTGVATDDLIKLQVAGVIYEVGSGSSNIVSVGYLPTNRSRSTVYLVRGDLAVVT